MRPLRASMRTARPPRSCAACARMETSSAKGQQPGRAAGNNPAGAACLVCGGRGCGLRAVRWWRGRRGGAAATGSPFVNRKAGRARRVAAPPACRGRGRAPCTQTTARSVAHHRRGIGAARRGESAILAANPACFPPGCASNRLPSRRIRSGRASCRWLEAVSLGKIWRDSCMIACVSRGRCGLSPVRWMLACALVVWLLLLGLRRVVASCALSRVFGVSVVWLVVVASRRVWWPLSSSKGGRGEGGLNTPGKISLWGIRSSGWATAHSMAHAVAHYSPCRAAQWRTGAAERAKTGLLRVKCEKARKRA